MRRSGNMRRKIIRKVLKERVMEVGGTRSMEVEIGTKMGIIKIGVEKIGITKVEATKIGVEKIGITRIGTM